MNAIKELLNKIVDLLVILILILSAAITVLAVSSRADGIPNLMGYTLLSVQTDSMQPTMNPGDLIVGRINRNGAQEFEVGDVVTFRMFVDRTLILNTHRIIEKETINNTIYYSTRGDNAIGADVRQIVSGDIVSSYQGIRLPRMGTALDYLRTQEGFFLVVLLPMIFLFAIQLYGFVVNLIEYNKEKAAQAATKAAMEAAETLTDEQKQQIIREYLESQGLQKEESDPQAE